MLQSRINNRLCINTCCSDIETHTTI